MSSVASRSISNVDRNRGNSAPAESLTETPSTSHTHSHLTARQKAQNAGVPVPSAPPHRTLLNKANDAFIDAFTGVVPRILLPLAGSAYASSRRPELATPEDTAFDRAIVTLLGTAGGALVLAYGHRAIKAEHSDTPAGFSDRFPLLSAKPLHELLGPYSTGAELTNRVLECVQAQRVLEKTLEFTPQARLDLGRAGMSRNEIHALQSSLRDVMLQHHELFNEAVVKLSPATEDQARDPQLVRARLDMERITPNGQWTPQGLKAERLSATESPALFKRMALLQKATIAGDRRLFPELQDVATPPTVTVRQRRTPKKPSRSSVTPGSSGIESNPISVAAQLAKATSVATFSRDVVPRSSMGQKIDALPTSTQTVLAYIDRLEASGHLATMSDIRTGLKKNEGPTAAAINTLFDNDIIDKDFKGTEGAEQFYLAKGAKEAVEELDLHRRRL